MILAVKRLRAIGWIALIFLVLIALYPLSLSVATQRSDLGRLERKIVSTKAEIRYLETEFQTRASLSQLEAWNDLGYGYVAPTADQYLEGERALANLGDPDGQMHRPVKVAAMTLTSDNVQPAGTIGSPFGSVASKTGEGASAGAPVPAPTEALKPIPAVDKRTPGEARAPMAATSLDEKLINRMSLEATVDKLREDDK